MDTDTGARTSRKRAKKTAAAENASAAVGVIAGGNTAAVAPPRVIAPTPIAAQPVKRKAINIIAMGSSREDFLAAALMEQRPDVLRDAETWVINYMGAWLHCDRIIHVDPVHPFLKPQRPDGSHNPYFAQVVKDMCDRAKERNIPFYTAAPHPEYSNHVLYPFHKIYDMLKSTYLNTTVAYALALALYEGGTDIGMFGCDFSYPDIHIAESGRACVEFWMGQAAARGVKIAVACHSTLLDMRVQQQPYGFWADPNYAPAHGGRLLHPQEILEYCDAVSNGRPWTPKHAAAPAYVQGVLGAGQPQVTPQGNAPPAPPPQLGGPQLPQAQLQTPKGPVVFPEHIQKAIRDFMAEQNGLPPGVAPPKPNGAANHAPGIV